MNTRSLLNILLLIVVAVLASVMYFQPGLEPDQETQKLTNLLPEQIDQIVIERKDNKRIVLTKKQEKWFITSPIEVAANSYRIEPLLQLVQASSQAQFGKENLDLAKYKLDQPAVTVRFNDTEITFGDSESLQNRRYVLVDNRVHLISDVYYYRLLSDVAGFVNTSLLPEGVNISKIELPDFRLEHGKDGHWSVIPEHEELSADAINTLLDEWRHAQAMQVSAYEVGPSSGTITIHIENSPALHLKILERDTEFILGRGDIGIQYHFTVEQGQQLLQLPTPADVIEEEIINQ